jgi:acylphosphatase
MKLIRVVRNIIAVALIVILTIFGALYVRYSTQSVAIHQAVNGFVKDTRSGTSESLQPFIHPEFFNEMVNLLSDRGPFFTRVVKVEEKKWYFDYSWELGLGETTEYRGTVFWDTQETGDYDLKLIKIDGRWVVYALSIRPHTVEESAAQ